jgi:hypothetical protein
MKRMRKCNDEIYQLAKDQTLVKSFLISVHIYLNNIKYKVQIMIYVTITDDHVTIFQIRLQTLMKLVGQAKYPST